VQPAGGENENVKAHERMVAAMFLRSAIVMTFEQSQKGG
jgi:hypothetical protein